MAWTMPSTSVTDPVQAFDNNSNETEDMTTETEQDIQDTSNLDTVQYLTFTLDGESFATEITKVREVLEHTEVTRVPRTPDCMQGVINLRGNVVPVIDMRLQFGMQPAEVTVDTCIIIIEVSIDGHSTVLGALADSVQEVIDLHKDQLEPAPTLGTRVNNKFIQAMGKASDGSFIILLNMDKAFSVEQLHDLERTGGGQEDTEAA